METKQEDKPGFVYLLHAEGTRRYKIGMTTTTVAARLKQINNRQSPYKAILVYSIPSDHPRDTEKILHRKFKSKKAHNEWFDFLTQAEVYEAIREMDQLVNKNNVGVERVQPLPQPVEIPKPQPVEIPKPQLIDYEWEAQKIKWKLAEEEKRKAQQNQPALVKPKPSRVIKLKSKNPKTSKWIEFQNTAISYGLWILFALGVMGCINGAVNPPKAIHPESPVHVVK